MAQSFVYFSGREFLPLLWKGQTLKALIKNIAGRQDWTQKYIVEWLMEKEPGFLISDLLTIGFDTSQYDRKGYVLRGSVATDGFRLQVMAYKIKELHAAHYRRLPDESIPSSLTSTVGGVDHYLKEVRNVIQSHDDVKAPWNVSPEKLEVLGLDLG
ncbi:hypothetical protein EDD11_002405 [Mortierella claussenii]|nr:hypothetical protein EDD11_002405 [Mortierella claussenii]